MDILENILSQEVVQKLGWTLLHSLWQGAVVVLLLAVLLRVLQKSSANLRYVISCLGLAVIVLLPVVTFYIVPAPVPISDVESVTSFPATVIGQQTEVYDVDLPLQRAAEYMQMFPAISFRQRAMNLCTSALPGIVFGWFIGVLVLCLWHLGGWAHLQRLKRKNINQVDASLKDKLRSLAERLKVTRPVKLMKSALVQIPTVVGCLRPVILLPASALTGLSSGQLEAVLAHELAHIYRYDYLVNMLQTVVEIVGFYHPAVWWISHKIRIERENCCDDLAVSVCGDKVGYARALTSMEEIRLAQGELVIAASGGNLFTRISRLVGNESAGKARPGWAHAVFSALLIIALAIPTTLALTATDSGSGLRTDSTTTHVSELVDEENINSSVAAQPASHLPGTDSNIQLLFDCKICELPADLKFPKIEQRKGIYGPIVVFLESLKSEREKGSAGISIQLGREYVDSLEALIKETKDVKVLSAPQVITLDGEEAIISVGAVVPYIAGYENGEDAGDEAKPIIKNGFAGLELKIKGKTKENGLKLDLNINYGQLKPSFGVHKDDEGREIQVPVIESRKCATSVSLRSGETVIIGGLKSQDNDNSQLLLVITPSIMRPEKGIESKVETDQRLLEQDEAVLQYKKQERALEEQVAGLLQLQIDVQRQLEDMEKRKAELKSLSAVLASPKEAESGPDWLDVMAAKYAERDDFAKAIEHQEKAIELAKARKYYGIGIAIGKTDGLIRISDVLPDAPASGSSFQQGDIIEAVDGVSTEGMSLDEVVARIVGPKGTKVTLTVKSHSQDITMKETFPRQLLLEGSQALRAYEWRLAAYKTGKTWPQYRRMMEDQKAQTAGAPRIFELRYASAEELAEVLSRVLERRWKGIKDKPANVVRIIPDPDTNRLIVIASPADSRLIEALIAELDVLAEQDSISLRITPRIEPKSDTPPESTVTRIIALKYADCESTEEKLMILFQDEQFRIVSDKRTNTLIVVATESTIQKILSLVAELDVHSREDTSATKTSPSSKLKPNTTAETAGYLVIQLKLKYADCESVSEKVTKLFSAGHQFKIVPDKRTNTLLIVGSESAIQQITALVTEIDVSGSDTDREVMETNKHEKADSNLTPSPSVK